MTSGVRCVSRGAALGGASVVNGGTVTRSRPRGSSHRSACLKSVINLRKGGRFGQRLTDQLMVGLPDHGVPGSQHVEPLTPRSRTHEQTGAPLLPPSSRLRPNSQEFDRFYFTHRDKHDTPMVCADSGKTKHSSSAGVKTPTIKTPSAEFSTSPCLKSRLAKQLLTRLSFLTSRELAITLGDRASFITSHLARLHPNETCEAIGE